MDVRPDEAKQWAKENLHGIITGLTPTFTADLSGLNEKAVEHDVRENEKAKFLGFSIITEAGTTESENVRFMEVASRRKGKLLTVLLATFPTRDENLRMVKRAREVGVDMIQLGYPAMWRPGSLEEVVAYTEEVCAASRLPVILWAAEMWGWCSMLEDPSNYPRELLLKFARIPNVVAIKYGTKDPTVLRELFANGIAPGTVSEPMWPWWIQEYGAQWGGISAYNHLYFCTEYFSLLRKGDWQKGMRLYFKMAPMRAVWGEMIRAEVGGPDLNWGWSGHNRLRWKYASWLVGLNGGPLRGSFRIYKGDMARLRKAAVASGIPVTGDDDFKFFEGRNPG